MFVAEQKPKRTPQSFALRVIRRSHGLSQSLRTPEYSWLQRANWSATSGLEGDFRLWNCEHVPGSFEAAIRLARTRRDQDLQCQCQLQELQPGSVCQFTFLKGTRCNSCWHSWLKKASKLWFYRQSVITGWDTRWARPCCHSLALWRWLNCLSKFCLRLSCVKLEADKIWEIRKNNIRPRRFQPERCC